jgi:hypothetical protein
MKWIDDAEEVKRDRKERYGRMRTEAPGIYVALWQELMRNVAEAQKIARFDSIVAEEGLIKMSPNGEALQVMLWTDELQIHASGVDVSIDLFLDVGDDGVVYLKFENERIEYPEAAREILQPFLFPELPPRWRASSDTSAP